MFELSGDDARDNALEAHEAAQNGRIERLRAALNGCLGLADTEAANGSNAWRKAAVLIRQVLEDTK